MTLIKQGIVVLVLSIVSTVNGLGLTIGAKGGANIAGFYGKDELDITTRIPHDRIGLNMGTYVVFSIFLSLILLSLCCGRCYVEFSEQRVYLGKITWS